MSHEKKLTTNAGAPVVDNQNVLTAGRRGPQLLQDVWMGGFAVMMVLDNAF